MLWPKVRALLAGLARRNHLEDELAEEIRGHIEERANELARSGVDPSEALRHGRLEFGSFNVGMDYGGVAREGPFSSPEGSR
jgi:hypothetical protein